MEHYYSPVYDMSKVIVKVVFQEIVQVIGEDKVYVVLADESTDINGNELMTIVIGYVYYEKLLQE